MIAQLPCVEKTVTLHQLVASVAWLRPMQALQGWVRVRAGHLHTGIDLGLTGFDSGSKWYVSTRSLDGQLLNLSDQEFNWRKQLRSRCLIEAQQISFIRPQGGRTRHRSKDVVPNLRAKRCSKIGNSLYVPRRTGEIQRIRLQLVVWVLLQHENRRPE